MMKAREPLQSLSRRRPSLVNAVLLLAAYVATGAGALWLVGMHSDPSRRVEYLAAPWLASGIGTAGLLLGGERLWPVLVVGAYAIWGGFMHDSPVVALVDAIGEAASIVLIIRCLSLWQFHRNFRRFRDPLVLLAAVIAGRVVATTFDVGALFAGIWLAPGSLSPYFRDLATDASGAFRVLSPNVAKYLFWWSLNWIAGIVLVVPVVAAGSRRLARSFRNDKLAFLGWALTLFVWCTIALSLTPAMGDLPPLVTALMIVAWAGIRFGVAAAAFGTLAMSLTATFGFAMNLGPFSALGASDATEVLWGFTALVALTGLFLSALLAERRRDLHRLTVNAQRYVRLFTHNPSPLWVADAHSGRILMVNDAAVRTYGYHASEVLTLTADEWASRIHEADPLSPAAGASVPGARAVQHRTRAGTVINAEIVSTSIELDGSPALIRYALNVSDRYKLRARLLAAADVERGRLAQELHDGLGQVLTGLSLGAQAATYNAARGATVNPADAEFLVAASSHAVLQCRELTRGVSPLRDANGDLGEALRQLPDLLPANARGLVTIFTELTSPMTLSLERSEHLYRIAQEAVANALKHARARHIQVALRVDPVNVSLSVTDDGIGFQAPSASPSGLGLRSIRMRANAVGAQLSIEGRIGGGTEISCVCPQVEEQTTSDAPGKAAAVPESESLPSRPGRWAARPGMHWLSLDHALRCLLLAVACLAGISVSALLAGIADPRIAMYAPHFAVPSLLIGVSSGVLLRAGMKYWPGVTLAAAIGAFMAFDLPWAFSIYYGLAMTLTPLIVASLLARWGFRRAFDRWWDPPLLLGAAVIASSVTTSLNFVATLMYQWLFPGRLGADLVALITDHSGASPVVTGAFLAALARWWADSVAGAVLVVPMIVALPPIWQTLRNRPGEAVTWSLAIVGWICAIFLISDSAVRQPLLALALTLLIWAAVRFGVALASAATFACAMAATIGFAMQRGALSAVGVHEGVAAVWSFLSLLTIIGMFVTALLAERNRTTSELNATAERYRRLFQSDPYPLWVEDTGTGRILMVNDRAIRHYGYSREEWLATTTDGLAADPTSARRPRAQSDGGVVEVRQRLKNHSIIDVELSYAPLQQAGRGQRLCFAIDVTERNSLRRGFLESTDRERRRLADQLSVGLAQALVDLEHASERFRRAVVTGTHDPGAIELVAAACQRAATICRETAHGASPLQANGGDLVAAIEDLATPGVVASGAQIEVVVRGAGKVALPMEQREHLYGVIREAVTDAVTERSATRVDLTVTIEPTLIRVAIEDDGSDARRSVVARLPVVEAMTLRATSVGARLDQAPRTGGGRILTCLCPQ